MSIRYKTIKELSEMLKNNEIKAEFVEWSTTIR